MRSLLFGSSSQEDQWDQTHRLRFLTAQPIFVKSRLEEKAALYHISCEAALSGRRKQVTEKSLLGCSHYLTSYSFEVQQKQRTQQVCCY